METASAATGKVKSEKFAKSGSQRFAWNLAFSWGAYLIQVASGFVMPRLIGDRLGQATLGIWDFSWSIVAYFGLLQLGLGGSINRYVARHRASGDTAALNQSVSTVALFLRSAGCLVAIVSIVTATIILPHFASSLGEGLNACRWVVLILGFKLAIELSLTTYGAVLVGCHRWDIHSSISGVTYAVSAVAMVLVILTGGGLPSLALAIAAVYVTAELVRWRMALRICPELEVRQSLASWRIFIEQARFSAKSLIPRVADVISAQTMSIAITMFLGPASLAIFARPRSLTMTLRTFAAKFGAILIPTTSALQAGRDTSSLQESLKRMPAALSSLILPAVVVLGIFGDDVIRFWMGESYVYPGLVTIFSIAVFPMLIQESIWGILTGLNLHGRVAMAHLIGSIAAAALLVAGMALMHWGLIGAAICFTIPKLCVDGVVAPMLACRAVGVPLKSFYWEAYLKPFLCISPFMFGLILFRARLEDSLTQASLVALIGAAMTLGLYMAVILPRNWLWRLLRR